MQRIDTMLLSSTCTDDISLTTLSAWKPGLDSLGSRGKGSIDKGSLNLVGRGKVRRSFDFPLSLSSSFPRRQTL